MNQPLATPTTESTYSPASKATIDVAARQHRDDLWNTISLALLLGVMACAALGMVVAGIRAHLGVLAIASGFAIAAGLIALAVYFLITPLETPVLYPRPVAPRITTVCYSPDRPAVAQSNEYSTLAIVAFVTVFATVIPGIVLGHLALRDIQRTGKRGRGLALAALIIGYLLLAAIALLWVLLLAVFG